MLNHDSDLQQKPGLPAEIWDAGADAEDIETTGIELIWQKIKTVKKAFGCHLSNNNEINI